MYTGIQRIIVLLVGHISVVLGFIGIFTPILPTTPFILLAAWCYCRTSEKWNTKLHNAPVFGNLLSNWEKNKSISKRSKIIAVTTIWISVFISLFFIQIVWAKICIVIVCGAVSIYILTRKTA